MGDDRAVMLAKLNDPRRTWGAPNIYDPTPEWLARLRANKEWAERTLREAGYTAYRMSGTIVPLMRESA